METDHLLPPVISSDNINLDDSTNSRNPRKFILEPAIVCLFFALNLSSAVFQNQVIFQTCTVTFHYNKSECDLLGTPQATDETEKIETQVQPYAAKIFMARILIESLIPSIVGLLFGAWSDKFGRKPMILCSFIGYCSIYLISALIAYLSMTFSINPWFYILAVIPESLFGGNCAFLTGAFCYIADITSTKGRPLRMGLLEASIYSGLMIGSFASSYILKATNNIIVFLISGIMIMICCIYIGIFLNESLVLDEQRTSIQFHELFDWNLVKDMLKTCFKPRENYKRLISCLIMLTLMIYAFVIEGTSAVFYLFVRKQFLWTIKEFTLLEGTGIIVQVIGSTLGIILLRKILKISVIKLALVAYGSAILNEIVKGVSSYSWELYLAIGVGFLKGIGGPMSRTILSNIIPPNEIGKMFALTTALESIAPLGSAPLYTYFYSKTINSYPGAFNFISVGMLSICFIFLSIIFGIDKFYSNQRKSEGRKHSNSDEI